MQLLPSDSSFPLCTWLACATKQACVRNQESTSRVYHFNKHLPAKHHFKWERPTLHFIWHPFCRWVCLDVIEQNRQVELCERKISHYKFWCTSMAKYYFPWNAIVESLWKFVCWFRSTSRFLYRQQEKICGSVQFTVFGWNPWEEGNTVVQSELLIPWDTWPVEYWTCQYS